LLEKIIFLFYVVVAKLMKRSVPHMVW